MYLKINIISIGMKLNVFKNQYYLYEYLLLNALFI